MVVDKNPAANAGNTGLISGPERIHMPWGNKVHVPRLLSLHSRALQQQLLKPVHPSTGAQRQEKSPQLETCDHDKEKSPLSAKRKPMLCNKDPVQPKINK